MTASRRNLLVAALCLIWGSTWLAIKIGLESMPPFFSAGLRFALAAAVLAVLTRLHRVPLPRSRRVHAGLLMLGVATFGASYGAVYWAEQYLTSGLTAVLFATHPFFVLLMASRVLPAERITLRKALGVALGFAGVALIFQADLQFPHPRSLLAALVALMSPVISSASNIAVKRWGQRLHPYTLTTLPMAYGASILLGVAAATEDLSAVRWTWTAMAAVLYLGVCGSVVAFLIHFTLLRHVAVSSLALLAYTYPVVALLLGYLVLGETLQPRAVAGTTMVLAGIAVAIGWRRAALPRTGAPPTGMELPSPGVPARTGRVSRT